MMIRKIIKTGLFCVSRRPILKSSNQKHQAVIFKFQYTFAVKKTNKQENVSSGPLIIKNDNLIFNSSDYQIFLYPFYPQVVKKSQKIFEISKFNSAMAITFMPMKRQSEDINANRKANWQNRKSIAFKFNQLSKIIQVDATLSKTWIIQALKSFKGEQKNKYLRFTNVIQKNHFKVQLMETFRKQNEEKVIWKIQTILQHSQFNLIKHLIQESLFDLSGMRLVYDVRRNQELNKLHHMDKHELQKDDLFQNYDNKDSVV